MSNNIQAVIWDMDGVIIDSGEAHRLAWHRMAQEDGLALTDEQFWATFGQRNDEIISSIWGSFPQATWQEMSDRKERYYRDAARTTATALPGAIELLSELHAAGYPQALASSAPVANIELVSEVLGLNRYLDALVSGDNVPRGKPAPDVFLKAAATLGIAPAVCLVIEDAVAGVEAAHAAGMRCIAVAGERDLAGLRAAELMVSSLTEVNLARIQSIA
jgi:beta-phosphoglucomutase